QSVFHKRVEYDLELDLKSDLLSFAKEIERLEPTGFGNPKPTFKMQGDNLSFKQIGATNHIKHSDRNFEVIGFTKIDNILSAKCKTDFEVSLTRNVFQNNETAQIIVRGIYVDEVKNLSDEDYLLFSIHQLSHLQTSQELTTVTVSAEEIANYLEKPFGTLFVCFTRAGLYRLHNEIKEKLPHSVGVAPNLNPENQIIICPSCNFDFRFFNNIIFAEIPQTCGYTELMAKDGKVKIIKDAETFSFPKIDENLLRQVFVELRAMADKKMKMQSLDVMLKLMHKSIAITKYELALALQIFFELHLLSVNVRGIIEVSNNKTQLRESATFYNLQK
ncbi:MAG TPA: hypothetical protein VJZ69_01850, partial [Clostridia bacterium]|nr:hypothetical protein [Clostridia bacterium]